MGHAANQHVLVADAQVGTDGVVKLQERRLWTRIEPARAPTMLFCRNLPKSSQLPCAMTRSIVNIRPSGASKNLKFRSCGA